MAWISSFYHIGDNICYPVPPFGADQADNEPAPLVRGGLNRNDHRKFISFEFDRIPLFTFCSYHLVCDRDIQMAYSGPIRTLLARIHSVRTRGRL
jgi:hypothetical protein